MLEIDERLAEQRKADREAFQQEKTDLLQERHAKKVELFELEQKASLDSWVRFRGAAIGRSTETNFVSSSFPLLFWTPLGALCRRLWRGADTGMR